MSSAPFVPPPWFKVIEDCLHVGGIPLTRLQHRVGQTPFYAYDRCAIETRIGELRNLLPPGLQLHYAVKANPMPALVQLLARLVDGLDVASGAELRIALDSGIAPERISFAGPGKRPAELQQAAAAGIVVNVESQTELEILAACGAALGLRPSFAVRVNPDFEMRSAGMRMSGGPKQFGVDAEAVPALLDRARSLPVEFVGFHIFSGSQNLRSSAIVESQQKSLELALQLAQHASGPVRVINIGGGFGIPYFPNDKALDLAPVVQNLHTLSERARLALPEAHLVLELGRYLVGEAGIYVCRVVERKISRGRVFLVTDGGMHHHLAASGNFGQVIRQNYPVIVGNRVRGTHRETASIVGPLCTPLDLLADQIDIACADVGDLVVIFQSGAYGYSASPTRFLSHPEAIEVLV